MFKSKYEANTFGVGIATDAFLEIPEGRGRRARLCANKPQIGKSRKTRVSMFSAETRQRKRPLWKGDDTLCADGRSCEFFLMCWMTAGLLDGSCGGIMYACCQRKDPKALVDYNLIESPRDQSRPLPLDLYTETASDDRKSSLRQA